ncbi:FtsL-like putative cell division protein [Blattabacterium cuenoti]|uniref:FtsL-like putative cell division protein n=1 Tax=Blattabacterium cuenoti TaxID=1653831 RepID=UPI00163CA051|nr:FtsL-like putative cell division protein [Blattabacterium cuenoti]
MSIQDILKGTFLIQKNSHKTWNFIIFLTALSLISITSSHIMDRKIREFTKISEEVIGLKSEYAYLHSKCMKMQLASFLQKKLSHKLKHLEEPPYELILNDQKRNEKEIS